MPTLRTSDGSPLVFTRLGALGTDPVIVVPGGPCRGVEHLEDLAGALDDRGAVVVHPRGTPTSGGRSHGRWNDADDVIALLDALSLPSADIVAHSAGTRLALAAAVRFGPRGVRAVDRARAAPQ